jgi:hypothetical protein
MADQMPSVTINGDIDDYIAQSKSTQFAQQEMILPEIIATHPFYFMSHKKDCYLFPIGTKFQNCAYLEGIYIFFIQF